MVGVAVGVEEEGEEVEEDVEEEVDVASLDDAAAETLALVDLPLAAAAGAAVIDAPRAPRRSREGAKEPLSDEAPTTTREARSIVRRERKEREGEEETAIERGRVANGEVGVPRFFPPFSLSLNLGRSMESPASTTKWMRRKEK